MGGLLSVLSASFMVFDGKTMGILYDFSNLVHPPQKLLDFDVDLTKQEIETLFDTGELPKTTIDRLVGIIQEEHKKQCSAQICIANEELQMIHAERKESNKTLLMKHYRKLVKLEEIQEKVPDKLKLLQSRLKLVSSQVKFRQLHDRKMKNFDFQMLQLIIQEHLQKYVQNRTHISMDQAKVIFEQIQQTAREFSRTKTKLFF
jgi:hypothetical protein